MGRVIRTVTVGLVALVCSGAWALPPPAAAGQVSGIALYRRHCAGCHGAEGRGDGPSAALFGVKPRDLRDGFLHRYEPDDLVRRVREGRALEIAVDLGALRARAAEVESVVAHMKRLAAVENWLPVDEGWAIYMQRCEQCHGPFGRPTRAFPEGVKPPRALSDPAFQAAMTDDALRAAIRHGRAGMPAPTPRPTEEEARAVATYLRLLSPGFETYSQYCANCHGDSGQGAPSGFDDALPTVTFDRSYFARRNPEEVRAAVWHMLGKQKPAMPHFAWTISEAETRAIIDYLRRLD